MKKITVKQALWLNNHAIRREKKIKRFNARYTKRMKSMGPPDWCVWTAPEAMSLHRDHRERLLRKIRKLRSLVANANGPVRLDFSHTQRLGSDGTLLFTAELRRLMRHFPKVAASMRTTLGGNHKVLQVFKQIGVLKLLRKSTWVEPQDEDVVYWQFTQGNKVEGEKFDEVLRGLTTRIAERVQTELYEAFIEAMNNVLHHAYIGVREDGLQLQDHNDWWMFSQAREDVVTVVFCDLGIGIPRTLPSKKETLWKRLVSLNLTSDADVIDYALQDSVTRTQQSGRGRGLKQLIDVVTETSHGEVAIFSNRGSLHYKSGGQLKKRNHSDSILGTLIHWVIPILKQDGVSTP